ncbi:MAG TPA: hypothetical protein VG755_22345 [Nannocystaceae bacterium]|nr:hypothetical protein [Nannocystaceae bacterium]
MRREQHLWVVLCVAAFACGENGGSTGTLDPSTGSSSSESSSGGPPVTTTTEAQDSSSESSDPETSTSDPGTSSSDDGEEGSICNNGVIEGNEECDCGGFTCSAAQLDDKLCSDLVDPLAPGPLTGGTLACNPASCRFDISMCSWCGDEIIGEHEECEPETPFDVTCSDLGMGTAGTVACGEACTFDASACTFCGRRFEFAGGGGCPYGFTVTKLDSEAGGVSWQCGNPSNYALGPGTDVEGVYATNLVGPYNGNESSALASPAIDLSMCAADGLELELVHWHDFEGGEDNSDGGIVQVSTDGTTWTTIAPASGALYDSNPISASYAPVDGAQGFSGALDENEWLSSVFDLSDYAGEAGLRVRMVFGSDAQTNTGGWYIDTLEVRGAQR